jgi:chromate reductase
MLGTARAQYHLRQCFVFLNGLVLNRPEVMIANAAQRFDEQGRLADEKTREMVRALLVALRAWAERVGPPQTRT